MAVRSVGRPCRFEWGCTVAGPVARYLSADHERLDASLQRAIAQPGSVDPAAYDEFRRGLLRHISIEEKILLPSAAKARGGEPLRGAAQLKRDHAALAALLVPTPTPTILGTIRSILVEHNPLEEGPQGIYEACEQLAGEDAGVLAARVQSAPEVPVARHYDTPLVREHIERLLALRRPEAQH
jgi:Hemerythrin HHE cation binding domain